MSLIEIRAAAGAQPPAILPAMGGDGQLQQQRLARLLAQIELAPIVEHHMIVGLEIRLEPTATRRTIRDHGQVHRERKIEDPQTAHAFEPGAGPQSTPYRDEIAGTVQSEGRLDPLWPFGRGKLEVLGGRPRFEAMRADGH